MKQLVETAMRHHMEGRLQEAEPIYKEILKSYPNEALVWHNMGDLEYRKRNYKGAVECLQRAFLLHPDNPNTLNTLAIALFYAGRIDEALKLAQSTVKKYPQFVMGYPNLGVIYVGHRRVPEAIEIFSKAISLKPDYLQAHLGLGFSYLTQGDLQKGWKEILWCQRQFPEPRPNVFSKAWEGEDIKGKTLFIYIEQGFGDLFHFVRYVHMLVEKGVKVLIENCPAAGDLLSRSLPAGASIYQGEPFDVACSIMNLGLFCGTEKDTIPSMQGYLQADPEKVAKWKKFFAKDKSYKVGLSWFGNPSHLNDVNRSTALATFAPLAEIEKCSFYGLQKGDDTVAPANMKFTHLSSYLETFDDTAAIIMNLDLVITVDTAVAHLAAALGKPTWVLLGFNPDYRWLLDREDTPWYPTMRLFRPTRPNQWVEMIAKIKDQMRKSSPK